MHFPALLCAAVLLGCSAPETSGSRIAVGTRIQGERTLAQGFRNDFGWSIELTRARVALEHLYYVTGDAVGTEAAWNPFVRAAYAHPGHYDAGEVLAEMNEHVVVDLLDDPVTLAPREGVTGTARSAVIAFGTLPRGAATIDIEGTASTDDRELSFRATVQPEALLHPTSDLPEVEGCPFKGELTANGLVTAELRTSVWLDQVDFSGIESALEQVELEPGTEAHNALVRGVRKAIAYSFSFESEKP